jgi:Ca-activated chloride channel family protein
MVARIPLALALFSLALAQSDNKQPAKPIKVQVNEVIVPVTVTDYKGRYVSNLEAKDFKVFDDDKEQHIEFFSHDRNQPLVVGFLIDLSNDSRVHWKNYQDAAIDLVLNILTGDKKFSGFLISYSNEPELQVNTTNEADKMVEKLHKMKPGGGSSLYDAIYMACMHRQVVEGEPYDPRRVIIVIGDGHDNSSKKSLDEVVEIAQRSLVTIYAMSTVSFGFTNEGDENMQRLTSETGGYVEYPLNNPYTDVFRSIAAIIGEVTTQYVLRYVPDTGGADAKQFRKIRIAVPELPTAKVRFRTGYYPFAP